MDHSCLYGRIRGNIMAKANKPVKQGSLKKRLIKSIPFYLLALPGLTYLFINNYMPLPGLVLAFKKYSAKKGIFGSDWKGLDNFRYLFDTPDAWIITRNTILYNVAFIVIGTVLAIFVAMMVVTISYAGGFASVTSYAPAEEMPIMAGVNSSA